MGVYSISDLEQKIEAVTKLEAEVLAPSDSAEFGGLEHHRDLVVWKARKRKMA
jgi:hypothetical protein